MASSSSFSKAHNFFFSSSLFRTEGKKGAIIATAAVAYQAAIVALGRTLGFIPLVMTTAIISGVYSPNGWTSVPIMLVWSICTLILVKFIYPNLSKIIESTPVKFATIITNIFVVFMVCLIKTVISKRRIRSFRSN